MFFYMKNECIFLCCNIVADWAASFTGEIRSVQSLTLVCQTERGEREKREIENENQNGKRAGRRGRESKSKERSCRRWRWRDKWRATPETNETATTMNMQFATKNQVRCAPKTKWKRRGEEKEKKRRKKNVTSRVKSKEVCSSFFVPSVCLCAPSVGF